MAKRIYPLTVTVPAQTFYFAPQTTPFITEDNQLDSIELVIPPGHNGLTGVRVMKGDTQLIPWGSGTWIQGNDYSRVFPVDDYVPTGDISVVAFNSGNYPHSFYLRMTMEDYTPQTSSNLASESQVINLGQAQPSQDPLSAGAILGNSTVDALSTGEITAEDLLPSSVDTTPPSPPQNLVM